MISMTHTDPTDSIASAADVGGKNQDSNFQQNWSPLATDLPQTWLRILPLKTLIENDYFWVYSPVPKI